MNRGIRLLFLIGIFVFQVINLNAQIKWLSNIWESPTAGVTLSQHESGILTATSLANPSSGKYRGDLRFGKEILILESEPYLALKIKAHHATIASRGDRKLNVLNRKKDENNLEIGWYVQNVETNTVYSADENTDYDTFIWDLRTDFKGNFKDGEIIPYSPNWSLGGEVPGSIRGSLIFTLVLTQNPDATELPFYEVYKIATYPSIEAALADKSTATEPTQSVSKDYLQFIIYGQSLGMGWEAAQAITTTPIDGNYMLGNSPLIKNNNQSTTLNPLVATKWGSGGEQPIVAAVNSFSQRYRTNVNANTNFIAMTGGEGGQTIEKLSKECTNDGFYESTFIKILDNTISAIELTNSTVRCPAIIYMQGEYNCNNPAFYQNKGLTPGTDGTTDKTEYKKLLLQLKNNMQTDIMLKYKQPVKPLFFIYQTSGKYIQKKEMDIAMAQYEFAQENDDVVMLNPHYAMPDYNGGHLSTNGYRWYGEIIGNILYDALVEEKKYKPLQAQAYLIQSNTITIDYLVPNPPLTLDTYTTPQAGNYGFKVYKNSSNIDIVSNVEVIDETKIKITCSDQLLGKIEVVYAGRDTQGSGNLRDSHNFPSMYTYYDDSSQTYKESYTPKTQSGELLYGQHYPMYNWAIGSYYSIQIIDLPSEINKNSSIRVFPFFDNKEKTLVINGLPIDTSVSIYDMNGKLLLKSNENKINMAMYSNGLYMVKCGSSHFKFIKN